MTIEEMKEKKREHGYTYNMMSQMSGVPLGTVQKIFTGETKSPRYDTLEALARIFENGDRDYLYADMVEDSGTAYAAKVQGQYTLDDYYALPEDRRVELIDGCIYDMAAPSTIHQLIAGEVHRQISNFILEHDGPCMPFISPVDVQLDCDDKTMVVPDIIIVCDPEKVLKDRIMGAPDFVAEIVSPSPKNPTKPSVFSSVKISVFPPTDTSSAPVAPMSRKGGSQTPDRWLKGARYNQSHSNIIIYLHILFSII